METKYFILSKNVSIKKYKLFLSETHIFDCNEDSITLINILLKFRSENKGCTINNILEALPDEKLMECDKKNRKIVGNILSYLMGCNVLNVLNEEIEK